MLRWSALFICAIFVSWLFAKDRKLRPMTSWGLWVCLPWIFIIGSRYFAYWLNAGVELEPSADSYLEGSPLDRTVFLLIIVAEALVLFKRKPDWKRILISNRWFFLFLLYCGISVIWSDYPFVSFKRWVKELGNVLTVLIIVTERDPVQATRAVLARYSYLVIPLSLVLIYFFPNVGTYYEPDTYETLYRGVTMEKNTLGLVMFICGLFLMWDLLYMRNKDGIKSGAADLLNKLMLLSMVTWLIYLARSSTSLVCMILGGSILLFMKFPFPRRQLRYLKFYSLATAFMVILFYSFPGILDVLVKILGRDVTLTGRTDIWMDLLIERTNPLVGTGYQSFWMGTRLDYFWESYIFHINQAHNGYLEVYLNVGLIGLFLLMTILVVTGSKLQKAQFRDSSFGIFLFALFVTALINNWTEARFSTLNLMWLVLSIVILYYPVSRVRNE